MDRIAKSDHEFYHNLDHKFDHNFDHKYDHNFDHGFDHNLNRKGILDTPNLSNAFVFLDQKVDLNVKVVQLTLVCIVVQEANMMILK